jgi:hypothetical protein
LSGWCYLKRRSDYLGEFHDKNGDEWEEFTDHESAVFFYWNEESNTFSFDKPEVQRDETHLENNRMLGMHNTMLYIYILFL